MIEPKKTVYDGIEFKSRLEAHWYVYLREYCHLLAVYEPRSFDFRNVIDNSFIGRYIPDFGITNGSGYEYFIEIKPIKSKYTGHDEKSLKCAYILGYQTPTIVILGSPYKYYAVGINHRHEGTPSGCQVIITKSGISYGYESWGLDCYPDEGVTNHGYDPRNCEYFGCDELKLRRQTLSASKTWKKLKRSFK